MKPTARKSVVAALAPLLLLAGCAGNGGGMGRADLMIYPVVGG